MPKVGIVYGTDSGALRRIILPDSDEQLNSQSWTGNGESFLALEYKDGEILTPADIDAALEGILGKTPPKILCAVVGADNVVKRVIAADPAIDSIPGHSLVVAHSKEIVPGCIYDVATEKFTVPARNVPEMISKETGERIPAHTIPAKELARSSVIAATKK